MQRNGFFFGFHFFYLCYLFIFSCVVLSMPVYDCVCVLYFEPSKASACVCCVWERERRGGGKERKQDTHTTYANFVSCCMTSISFSSLSVSQLDTERERWGRGGEKRLSEYLLYTSIQIFVVLGLFTCQFSCLLGLSRKQINEKKERNKIQKYELYYDKTVLSISQWTTHTHNSDHSVEDCPQATFLHERLLHGWKWHSRQGNIRKSPGRTNYEREFVGEHLKSCIIMLYSSFRQIELYPPYSKV